MAVCLWDEDSKQTDKEGAFCFESSYDVCPVQENLSHKTKVITLENDTTVMMNAN